MNNMKSMVFSSKVRIGLVAVMAACLLPVSVLAAKSANPAPTSDSTYAYVAEVFDKLQSHWEQQTYENRVTANNVLTFTLNEDGSLNATNLAAGSAGDASGQAVTEFLKKNAPYGPFPSNLKGRQLEFKVKLSAGSLQMLGYQVVEKEERDSLVSYAAPASAQPVSLFYARALPTTPGKVWETPDAQTNNEKSMSAYVASVQEQIRQNWRLAQDYKFQRVIAMLMIDRDGTLLGAQLKQSSGDKIVDKAALNAIYTAGPFPKAPADVQSLPVMIEYIFDPYLVDEDKPI